jgi:LEA14-like dessication related protein
VQGFRFEGLTPVLTLKLAVQNTSNQSFTLKSFAGNVWANNYLVGVTSSFDAIEIKANAQTLVPIKVRLSLLGIVNDIIQAITTHSKTVELELDSHANVDNLQVPVNIKYKV